MLNNRTDRTKKGFSVKIEMKPKKDDFGVIALSYKIEYYSLTFYFKQVYLSSRSKMNCKFKCLKKFFYQSG